MLLEQANELFHQVQDLQWIWKTIHKIHRYSSKIGASHLENP